MSFQVHLHADHVVLRDGKDFRCPKKHCDKVYPNRENLRLHIAAHYHGGGATPTPGTANFLSSLPECRSVFSVELIS